MTKHIYGWVRDLPDHRDFKLKLPDQSTQAPACQLALGFPDLPYDQGQIGSCGPNMAEGLLRFDQKKQNLPNQFKPSRLFMYYNVRDLEGTTGSDSGCSIRDLIKTINQFGVCPENGNPLWSWGYSDNPIQFRIKPWPTCYKDALLHPAVVYQSVAISLNAMKGVLAGGYPFGIGISVYESFESDQASKTGTIPLPQASESLLGGHAIAICGYDDDKEVFTFRNSWGTSWGAGGYGTLPYAYLTNTDLAADAWVIRQVK